MVCFRGGLYTCLYKVLFWLYTDVFIWVFWVVPGAFYFVFVNIFFVVVLSDYFLFPPSYFKRFILVLFCYVVYGVLCLCCVCFVYSLSRTWLDPAQRCMYDTCYMSVLSHKIMQKCEKLHNKTLQNTTSVHVN